MTTNKDMQSNVTGAKRKLDVCNPSVCIGGAQPTSCVCPTPSKAGGKGK